tara:strand:- start:2331 stop:3722 length:1392 start_codon:yes stop_codon:yes gene_type:complete
MTEYQKTIKDKIYFSGTGIHTGVKTNMLLVPAKENTGIYFVRTDLKNKPIIHADIDNVFATNRSTSLKSNNVEIHTTEHILAAITGLEIDNIEIQIDNIEIPIFDGSSQIFTDNISKVGIKNQKAEKKFFEISKKISFVDEESGTKMIAVPDNEYVIDVTIDYDSKVLGIQSANIKKISEFKEKISSSRTFCFLHELEQLIDNKLVKGGDLNNAIVVVENKITEHSLKKIKNIFNKKQIKINKKGYLNNLDLRHDNEPARHKLLDVVGDLALVGRPLKGKIIAYKPGHKNNVKFAKKIKKIMMEQINKQAPKVNFDEAPLLDKEKIKSILPHREPFLFIDEIREIGQDSIVGVKYVKKEEDYFKGHFPQEPVMPGVLQLETMAQTGGVLILNTVENPQDYLTFFMKIDNAKFKQKVVPGDILIFKLNLISPIRRGLCHMRGLGFVNDKIVVEADLLAQIAPKK